MPTNPIPLTKNTIYKIIERHPELSNYILPETSKGRLLTFRNNASGILPFKFGFPNLDNIQDIAPGLYILGGGSSMGKSTFALQLSDQIAFQGQPVLYFSREMSEIDMMTKSLSRLINQQAETDKTYSHFTALDIRKGRADNTRELREQLDFYQTHGQCNLSIIKLNSETDIYYIIDFIRDFMQTTGKRPVIVIDYLQIIGSTKMYLPDGRVRLISDNRENIQKILELIKDFQLVNNLMVIMICSLNRTSYTDPIKFEAFKETGSIEYTADVLWGLQFSVWSKELLWDTVYAEKNPLKRDAIKRQILSTEKSKATREIALKCLKNRIGVGEYEVHFYYQTQYDTYVPNLSFSLTAPINSNANNSAPDIFDYETENDDPEQDDSAKPNDDCDE